MRHTEIATRLLLLHAPADIDAARTLQKHIEPACRRCRCDISISEMTVGESTAREIERHIREANHVLVMVTAELLSWRLWTGVAGPALEHKKRGQVLVVKWSDCLDRSDEVLRRFQDVEPPKSIVSTANVEKALTALAHRVEDVLRRPLNSPEYLALGDLPSPEKDILGREHEWTLLDAALDDPEVHVVLVVGEGGSGKTQLVRTWLDGLQPAYRGADAVIACAVEDQGGRIGPEVSGAPDFLLRTIGGAPLEDPMATVSELVRRVRAQKTIAVIDGLEPLQGPSGDIRDRATRALIRDLASEMNGGLLVITTRPPFAELTGSSGVRRVELGPIDPISAVSVLRRRGVRGPDEQLLKLSERLHRHALLLALVSDYLVDCYEGDAMAFERFELSAQDIDEEGQLARILSEYERRLSPIERSVLGVVALCERPATIDLLQAFAAASNARGFVSALRDMTLPQLRKTCARLERTALLSKLTRDVWEQHPMVRSWWRDRLAEVDPDGVRSAHDCMFKHYLDSALPVGGVQRREDLEPLHAAVAHGVRAGRWREAFDVLHDRIREGERHTSLKKHGTVAEDLRAFLSFFDRNNLQFRGELPAAQRYWLENSAGVLLRARGRPAEATSFLRRAVEGAPTPGMAAESARNLASVLSLTGNLVEAVECCECAIRDADISGEVRPRLVARDFCAHLLHRLGRLREARSLLVQIENIRDLGAQDKGMHYPFASQATLLIDLDELDLAHDRASRAVELTRGNDPDAGSLLNRGLALRSLARVLAAMGKRGEAACMFPQAVDLVRQAGRYDHLAPCLLDMAFFLADEDPLGARRRLTEARRISEGRGFRLIDAHAAQIAARLAILEGCLEEARAYIDDLDRLLRETRYCLRVPRLHMLRASLAVARDDLAEARVHAERARCSASEMGLRARDLWQDINALLPLETSAD